MKTCAKGVKILQKYKINEEQHVNLIESIMLKVISLYLEPIWFIIFQLLVNVFLIFKSYPNHILQVFLSENEGKLKTYLQIKKSILCSRKTLNMESSFKRWRYARKPAALTSLAELIKATRKLAEKKIQFKL